MIVITGAAGFIGSCLTGKLNDLGHKNLLLVDDFAARPDKVRNLLDRSCIARFGRMEFLDWLDRAHDDVTFVFHMGARTDTTEKDWSIFERLNLNYTKALWERCTRYRIPLVYASSAATYGDGALGYDDRHELPAQLKPLNPYGVSKNEFDIWALRQKESPPFWAGLKFFNVYGPNEYHKGRMASVVYHTFRQIRESGGMKLFRSHRPGIADGHQKRDFIYVKDVVDICYFLLSNHPADGLYNVGSGQARTFLDLAKATFHAMQLEPKIEFVDTPEDIRDTYQYFTQANMDKLRGAGYARPFFSLEEGVGDYVKGYLLGNKTY